MKCSATLRTIARKSAILSLGLFGLASLTLIGSATTAFADEENAGAVYAETNTAVGNAVVVFNRDEDGKLTPYGTFYTGGAGTGARLNTQGEVILSPDNKLLFAVNAGSNEISVFAVKNRSLTLLDKISSGGTEPVSLTLHDDLLYVLNRKGVSNISGFKVSDAGKLTAIANSTQPLTVALPDAAQIAFNPSGKLLVVTEKATNTIDTFVVKSNGRTIGPVAHPSAGQTPFGFSFGPKGELIVTEAFGGAANASAVSLYVTTSTGGLNLITGSAPTHQSAACWSVTTKDGKYTYSANTSSGTISGFYIGRNGSLTLLDANGITGGEPDANVSKPADLALTPDSKFIYVNRVGVGAVEGWRVEANGSLTSLNLVTILPLSACGLIAR